MDYRLHALLEAGDQSIYPSSLALAKAALASVVLPNASRAWLLRLQVRGFEQNGKIGEVLHTFISRQRLSIIHSHHNRF